MFVGDHELAQFMYVCILLFALVDKPNLPSGSISQVTTTGDRSTVLRPDKADGAEFVFVVFCGSYSIMGGVDSSWWYTVVTYRIIVIVITIIIHVFQRPGGPTSVERSVVRLINVRDHVPIGADTQGGPRRSIVLIDVIKI